MLHGSTVAKGESGRLYHVKRWPANPKTPTLRIDAGSCGPFKSVTNARRYAELVEAGEVTVEEALERGRRCIRDNLDARIRKAKRIHPLDYFQKDRK